MTHLLSADVNIYTVDWLRGAGLCCGTFKKQRTMDALIIILVQGYIGLVAGSNYPIDTSPGLGRRFDGIGGISGGGVRHCILSYVPSNVLLLFTEHDLY